LPSFLVVISTCYRVGIRFSFTSALQLVYNSCMMSRRKRKTQTQEDLFPPDQGETTHERIGRVLDDILSGTGRRKPPGLSLVPTKGAGRKPVTDEALARALSSTLGRVSHAAIIVGLDPRTVRTRIRGSEMLTKIQEEIKEFRIDLAEGRLDRRVLEDKWPAIQFLLETQAKHRGYTKRQEVTGAEGSRLVFEFSDGSTDKDA